MSIFIGADICPRENCFELFTNSKTDELLGGELSKLLQESDFNIFNLECPLADKSSPIKKLGTNFIMDFIKHEGNVIFIWYNAFG